MQDKIFRRNMITGALGAALALGAGFNLLTKVHQRPPSPAYRPHQPAIRLDDESGHVIPSMAAALSHVENGGSFTIYRITESPFNRSLRSDPVLQLQQDDDGNVFATSPTAPERDLAALNEAIHAGGAFKIVYRGNSRQRIPEHDVIHVPVAVILEDYALNPGIPNFHATELAARDHVQRVFGNRPAHDYGQGFDAAP